MSTPRKATTETAIADVPKHNLTWVAGKPLETHVPRLVTVQPTQLRRPWRTTARSVFQAFVALCVMAPLLVTTAGLDVDKLPWLAGFLAIAAGVTRVMALPQVEAFLRRFVPWLAAAPRR